MVARFLLTGPLVVSVVAGLSPTVARAQSPSASVPPVLAPVQAEPETREAAQNAAQNKVPLTVPLREGRIFRGEIDIRVAPDGSGLEVDARQLARLFEGRITPAAAAQLLAAANGDGFATREEAVQAALDLGFDTASVEVRAEFAAAARTLTNLSLASRDTRIERSGRTPTGVSGFVNLTAFTTADDFDGSYDINDPSLDIDAAVHIAPWRHLTVEGGATVRPDGDIRRTGVRAVLFDEDGAWAARAGDVSLTGIGYMGSASILGAEYTNRTRFTSRTGVVRNIGERSFFLEKTSIARLIVNGVETQTFDLDPGPYTVSDFPLADGANDVVFVIEDETGEVDRVEFDVFADVSLLAPGEYEYGISGGIVSSASSDGFDYDGDPVAAAFVEAGVTNNLSAGGGIQATTDARLVTGIARLGTSFGRFDAQAAASDGDVGTGFAARLSWRERFEIDGLRSDPSLGLSAEYRSEDFGSIFSLDLFNDTEWLLNASYSQPLPYDLSLGLGLSYAVNRLSEDALTGSVSLGRSFGPWGLRAETRYRNNARGDQDEVEGFLRLTYDIDARSNAFVDYETNDNSLTAGYSRTSEQGGVGAWGYTIGASRVDGGDIGLTGGANYIGNRFELSANQTANVASLDGGDGGGMRTSLRAGTSIAFAEGKVAVGRPVRNGFAIFDTHPNLEDRRVLVGVSGDDGDYIAASGPLGPALVPGIGGGFGVRSIPYDVDDLPLGYDLGTGIAELEPRYKAGFAVEVGSAYTVTVIGNLMDERGESLPLKIGTAMSLDDANAPEVEVFTNRSGRFGAQGLAPGRWRLTMRADPTLTYDLTIPAGAVGLVRIGDLSPNET